MFFVCAVYCIPLHSAIKANTTVKANEFCCVDALQVGVARKAEALAPEINAYVYGTHRVVCR